MIAWGASCSLFESHQAPAPRPETPTVPPHGAPLTRLPPATIRSERVRSAPVVASKPPQRHLNQPPPQLVPVVTLEGSEDTKADAQRLLDQVTLKMTRVDRGELGGSTASTYQQANELINAAQRAMADRDYLAASSLAEKASALTSELPSQK
jgi:hypothetical protein